MPNNVQDNKKMTFFRKNLTAVINSAVAYTLNTHVSPTDIVLKPEHTSETSKTDVVFRDWPYSNYCGYDWHPDDPSDRGTEAIIALTHCVSLSGSKCQKFNVRFDNRWVDVVSTNWKRALVCHEVGHTLGLLHRNNSGIEIGCMPLTLPLAVNYSSHDVPHINANY